MTPAQLATSRYRLLLEQLAESVTGRHRGWKARAAKLLQVHPSYVSRILNEPDLEIGNDVVNRAIASLRLSPRFFYDASVDQPQFRQFVIKGAGLPETTYLTIPELEQKEKEHAVLDSELLRAWSEVARAAGAYLVHSSLHRRDALSAEAREQFEKIAPAYPMATPTGESPGVAVNELLGRIEEFPMFFWLSQLHAELRADPDPDAPEEWRKREEEMRLLKLEVYALRLANSILHFDQDVVNRS